MKKYVLSVLFTTVLVLGIVLGIAGPVGAEGSTLTGISITGTAQVGGVLTAVVAPSEATATYQWEESTTTGGIYTSISGATSGAYTPVAGDQGKFIEVVATGVSPYSGTVTSMATSAVAPQTALTGLSITGTAQVGGMLTAVVAPSGATVTYQWQSSNGGSYTPISGATSGTYTPVSGDQGNFIKVAAMGTGIYSGIVTSAATSAVAAQTPITAIAAITGTAQVGSTLTAGALTPTGATATYQWTESTTMGGTYTAIDGATSPTYTLVSGDQGNFIKVVATGTGIYSGTVTSTATSAVIAQTALTGLSITGTAQVGGMLTAVVAPSGATVTYQWQSSNGGSYTPISGATSGTYTPVSGDQGNFIKVAAMGTGIYSGIVTSAATSAVAAQTPITAIAAITGTAQVGSTLTAGALTPTGATATYQWTESTTMGGTYTAIDGATSPTYTLVSGDQGNFIKVVATGTGIYSGTVTSAATSLVCTPLTSVSINGTAQVGGVLTAVVAPSGATVTYQWQWSAQSGGTYAAIPSNSTASTYTPVAGDQGKFIKVVATGVSPYCGIVTSAATSAVAAQTALTGVTVTGTVQVGNTLTAVVAPAGATVTYQWTESTMAGGIYSSIPGSSTANAYTLVTGDATNYIEVIVTGTGAYSGKVISAATSAVAAQTITSVTIVITPPVVGGTPQTTIENGPGYTGEIGWDSSVVEDEFVVGTPVAEVTLTADPGYTFTGIPESGAVTIDGSTEVHYSVEDGELYITVSYAALTQQVVITTAAIVITTPVIGATAQTSVGNGTGYTGTSITWTSSVTGGNFVAGTPAATVVLTAGPTYTFTGITATGAVTIAGSTTVTYAVTGTTGGTLTITVGWPPLYDHIIHLNGNGWTLVSTDNYIFTSGPKTSAFSGSVTMIYKYTGTGWSSATVADLNPVTALYVKTTGSDGQLGLNYDTTVYPAPSTVSLVAGWNLISTASIGYANNILSSLRYVQVGTQQQIGLATLVSQGGINKNSGTFYVDATNWNNLSGYILSPFDGYWVYMNAPTTFGVIPAANPAT